MSESTQPGPSQGPGDRPPAGSRSPDRSDLWLVGVAILAVAGGLTWWWLGRRSPPPPPPVVAAAPPAEAAPPTPGAQPTAPPPGPADQAALLDAAARDATLRKLLAGDGLADRAATALANLAGGLVPRRLLEPLAPKRPFAVLERGDRIVVDPASFHRFDTMAAGVRAVDAAAAATAWKALHPALEVAWKALGEPEASVDQALARALSRLEAAPVEAGDLAVVPPPDGKGPLWQYADPTLEALPPVEKQLLRMGPANAKVVKAKAAELRGALGLPLVKPAAKR